MVTLGLDISTTCVGYAFTKNKQILDMGFIDIKKQKTPKEKVQKVLEVLNRNGTIFCDDYDLSYAPGVKKAIDEFVSVNNFNSRVICNERFAIIEKN